MANLQGFNAEEVEPAEGGFPVIPAGDYTVIITQSEMKPGSRDPSSQVLHLQLQVVGGPNQNFKLRAFLNLVNKNETAQKIGKGQLSAICRAVGVMTPNDSSELHNKPLTAVVTVQTDGDGNKRNQVSGFKPQSQATPTTDGGTPF